MGSRKYRVVGRGTMKLHLISILALWSCAEWGRVDAQNRPTMPNFPDFDPRGAQHSQSQHDAMEISDSEANWSEEECCPCKHESTVMEADMVINRTLVVDTATSLI